MNDHGRGYRKVSWVSRRAFLGCALMSTATLLTAGSRAQRPAGVDGSVAPGPAPARRTDPERLGIFLCGDVMTGRGIDQVRRYLGLHAGFMVGDPGPVAIMSEIPSLKTDHREEILSLSRVHSTRFERVLEEGIKDGSIRPCDVRMTGNAIMGALNWIPKWYHGDPAVAEQVVTTFPDILARGLEP